MLLKDLPMCSCASEASAPFVEGVFLPDLGLGTGIAIWGFRACASGHSQCPPITKGFERVFGKRGPEALADVLQLARIFGFEGRRRIAIAEPGCGRMTADEVSMAAMLAAAQRGAGEERDNHATWLLGQLPGVHLTGVIERIAEIFSEYDLSMDAPEVTITCNKALDAKHSKALFALEGGRA